MIRRILWILVLVCLLPALNNIAVAAVVKSPIITASASPSKGGSISPSGKIVVLTGESRSFTISAASGYDITDVKVDNKSVGAVSEYSFTNVTASHTIKAYFKVKQYTVTASAGSNGSISPKGSFTVNAGTSKKFTAKPAKNYMATIKKDGTTVATGDLNKPISYTLSNIQGNAVITAVFSQTIVQPPKSMSLAIIGLGDSIKVTNTTPVTISGLAASDAGISNVACINTTTGVSGTVTGTTQWSAVIALQQGDNVIGVTAYAPDGTSTGISTTLTYYPQLNFTSALTVDSPILYVNEAKAVTFKVGVKDSGVVSLYGSDTTGAVSGAVGEMVDNGVLPDEIQSDGIYTLQQTLTPTVTGYTCYRAGVTVNAATYYSENHCLWVTGHLTSDTVSNSVNSANTAEETFQAALNSGKTVAQAAADTVTQLKKDTNIGAVDSTSEGGVWWVSNDGIIGAYHPSMTGQKAGGAPAGPVRESGRQGTARASRVSPHGNKGGSYVHHYPAEYLLDRSMYVPLGRGKNRLLGSDSTANEIKSKKALIISPYINNPNDGPNFGNNDDYYVPWQTLKNKQACALFASSEVLNNNPSLNVTIDSFTNLQDYGYIHISAHGDNFFEGLGSIWKDAWGPNDFLKGGLSQVIIYSGLKLPKNGDGTFNVAGYEDDIKAKRVAVAPDGSLALLPLFFYHYTDSLPNSLVVLSACRSMYNDTMADAFLSLGAGAVVGFSDYVKTSYAQNTINTILTKMFDGKTVSEGVQSAIAAYGSNDADDTPAYLLYVGADDLVLSSGSLANGGFEDGVLSPWTRSGDGRIITQLGDTEPTAGSYMGIISTGLGYTTENGQLSQDFCASANIDMLTFKWNFFSEEFLEWCGSQYQDAFRVSVCVIDDATGAETCDQVFYREVDDLCGIVSKSDVGFDQGDVYNTGWLTAEIDVSAYASKHLRLKFFTTDVGDSIYDTAVLLDEITITEKK